MIQMVKIHIDHIDNDDGRVWAVQDGKKYHRVHTILIDSLYLESRTSSTQPRAFLYGEGVARIIKNKGKVIAVISRV